MKKFLLFLVAFGALIAFQYKIVVPLVHDVATSDLYLTDLETQADIHSHDTPMTNYAFMHCNNYIRDEIDSDLAIAFPSKSINSWDIAGYQYVINAEIEISSSTITPYLKKYVCRIKYNNGSDQEGLANSENWSVYGLSGLNEI